MRAATTLLVVAGASTRSSECAGAYMLPNRIPSTTFTHRTQCTCDPPHLRLCVAHDVFISSDEVWGEMPLTSDAPFQSVLQLLPHVTADGHSAGVDGLREKLILLISPSKCFNVASLDLAVDLIDSHPHLADRSC